jgi:hypothetical protein
VLVWEHWLGCGTFTQNGCFGKCAFGPVLVSILATIKKILTLHFHFSELSKLCFCVEFMSFHMWCFYVFGQHDLEDEMVDFNYYKREVVH